MDMQEMEQQIRALKERNERVEQDKAWETSFTRRFFIAVVTYIFAGIFLRSINDSNFLLNAVVPTAGYILSVVSLPPLRKFWANHKK